MLLGTLFTTTVAVFTILTHRCLGQEEFPTSLSYFPSFAIRQFLGVKYELVSMDWNLHKVLELVGVNWVNRLRYDVSYPELMLEWDGRTDTFTLSQHSLLVNENVTFQIGETVSKTTFDDRTVQASYTLSGHTITETDRDPGKPTLVMDIAFSDKHVVINYKVVDIISYAVYDVVSKAN